MEKPGGVDLKEFERLISFVKQNNLVFHIGYMYRYNPYIIDLLNQVKKGEVGEIISVEAQMNFSGTIEFRNWLKNLKGGMMFFLGCHLIDIILKIQGTPKRIIPLNKTTHLGECGDDFGMAVLEYENGVSFAKAIAMERGGFARRQLVVTGTEKTVELKPIEMYSKPEGSSIIYSEKTEYKNTGWLEYGSKSRSELFDRYEAMMRTFAKMVEGEIQNINTPDYELILYKTILQCSGALE